MLLCSCYRNRKLNMLVFFLLYLNWNVAVFHFIHIVNSSLIAIITIKEYGSLQSRIYKQKYYQNYLLQSRHINYKTVPHISFQHTLIGLINFADRNHFYI